MIKIEFFTLVTTIFYHSDCAKNGLDTQRINYVNTYYIVELVVFSFHLFTYSKSFFHFSTAKRS